MMSGIFADGEKATQLTQSVCMSSVMVYLHSARVFQRRMVRSQLPDTIWRLSAENATLKTSLVWPWKQRTALPVFRSQSRRVLSQEPDSANWPSEERVMSCTASPWPARALRAYPQGPPSLSLSSVSSQT